MKQRRNRIGRIAEKEGIEAGKKEIKDETLRKGQGKEMKVVKHKISKGPSVFLGGSESACQCRRHSKCWFYFSQDDPLEYEIATNSTMLA